MESPDQIRIDTAKQLDRVIQMHWDRASRAGGAYRELYDSVTYVADRLYAKADFDNRAKRLSERDSEYWLQQAERLNRQADEAEAKAYQLELEEAERVSTEEDSSQSEQEHVPPSPPPVKHKEDKEQAARLAKLRRTMSDWRKGRRVSDFAEPPLDWVPPPPRARHSLPGPSRPTTSATASSHITTSSTRPRQPKLPAPAIKPHVFNPKPQPIIISSDESSPETESTKKRKRKAKGKGKQTDEVVVSSGGGKEGSFIKKLRRISREGGKGEDEDDD